MFLLRRFYLVTMGSKCLIHGAADKILGPYNDSLDNLS